MRSSCPQKVWFLVLLFISAALRCRWCQRREAAGPDAVAFLGARRLPSPPAPQGADGAMLGARRLRPISSSACEGKLCRRGLSDQWASHPIVITEPKPVIPVYTCRTIPWPGQKVTMQVTASHRQLFEDLLMNGNRQIFMPLSLTTYMETDQVDVPAADSTVASLGPVVRLESMREVDVDPYDGGLVYAAEVTVIGRAQATRFIEPGVDNGEDASDVKLYLRSEIELLDYDDDSPGLELSLSNLAIYEQLREAWSQLQNLSTRLGEPRLPDDSPLWLALSPSDVWQLADFWLTWQHERRLRREVNNIHEEVRHFIWRQQELEHSPNVIDVTGMDLPRPLQTALYRSQNPSHLDLDGAFWEPFYDIFRATTEQEVLEGLLKQATSEVEMSRSRLAVKSALDEVSPA